MHNASEVPSRLHGSSCPHNGIELPCVFHTQHNTRSGGILTPRQTPTPQTICPILQSKASSLSQSRRLGGLFFFFAHYRRRLPAGSLCSTITALWGCLTEAKETEQQRQRVWRCCVHWYLLLHQSWVFGFSSQPGSREHLFCVSLFLSLAGLVSLQLFLSFSPFYPTNVARASENQQKVFVNPNEVRRKSPNSLTCVIGTCFLNDPHIFLPPFSIILGSKF